MTIESAKPKFQFPSFIMHQIKKKSKIKLSSSFTQAQIGNSVIDYIITVLRLA